MRPEVLDSRFSTSFGHLNRPATKLRDRNRIFVQINGGFCHRISRLLFVWRFVIPENQFAELRSRCRWAYKPVSNVLKTIAVRCLKLQARRVPKSMKTRQNHLRALIQTLFFVFWLRRRSFANMCPVSRRERKINPHRHLNPKTKSVRPRDGEPAEKSSPFLFVLLGEKKATNGRVGEMFGRNNRCKDSMPHAIAQDSRF